MFSCLFSQFACTAIEKFLSLIPWDFVSFNISMYKLRVLWWQCWQCWWKTVEWIELIKLDNLKWLEFVCNLNDVKCMACDDHKLIRWELIKSKTQVKDVELCIENSKIISRKFPRNPKILFQKIKKKFEKNVQGFPKPKKKKLNFSFTGSANYFECEPLNSCQWRQYLYMTSLSSSPSYCLTHISLSAH